MRNPLRKLTAAVAALGVGLGLTLVATSAADAATIAPTTNQVLRGNFQFTTSGLGDGSLCVNATKSNVTWSLINSANQTVWGPTKVDAVNQVSSAVIDTHAFPNGAYTARAVEQRRTGTIICSNPSSTTINTPVTIDNITDIVFNSPPSSGPQNTSVPVSATLTDPNAANPAVANATVTFALGGGASVNATTNASGVATANLPLNGAPRTTTISASFAQTAFLKGSSTSRQFDVTKNSTSTTLAQPAAVVHGQSTSFTATVASTNGLATAPTGTVQFTVDGNNFGAPVALSSGVANSVSTSSLSTATHTIGAIYSGSSDHLGSSAATKDQVVNKAATTTTISDTPSGSTVSGEAVTFKAHVDIVPPGVGTLAGGVQFYVDGDPFGTAVPLGAGDNASVTISNLTVANHDVYAVYNGNADFAQSSSATLTHCVGKAATTLDLTSSANPAFSGQPITYTAVVAPVAPGAGNPTGGVQFAVDGVNLGAPVPLVGGQAVSPVSNQLVNGSPHVITANYEGDANFSGQTDSLNQTVVAALTTTSLSASPSPSVFGQAVTLHAEVTPNAPATGNPVGFIAFYIDGGSTPAGFVALAGGEAEFTTSSLAVGAHTFKAVYASTDLNFFFSESAVVNHDVNKAATKTTVTTSANPAVFGQPITFTANVSVLAPGAGSPAGTIVFKDGATVIGTEPVSASTGEQASITVSNLSVGSHAITATYSGDDSFNGSVGNTPQTVTRAQTTTTIASSANPAANGEGIQFTATVSPVAPGAGVPTGNVRFFVNGANLGGSYPLVDGVVTSPNFASLTPGTYTITTSYNGDSNFVGSNGVLAQGTGQNITKGNTSLAVVSGPSPSAYGDTVTVTTTVKSVAPASGKPTGVVQIWEGDELVGATSLVQQSAANTSVATFTTASLSAGTHSLTATYVGNFNFNGQTGTTTQVVGQIPTVTGITSANNPAVYGDIANLTATVNTAAGTPSGTVTFKEGSTVLGTAPVGDGGQATLAVADLHAGSHAIKATYNGDASHAASTSQALNQVITKAPTKVLAGDVNRPGDVPLRQGWIRAKLVDRYGNPMAGRSISFDAPPGAARPARHLCDALTNAQGIAECDTQVISIDLGLDLGNESLLDIHGTYNVTYAGDADTIGDSDQGYQY